MSEHLSRHDIAHVVLEKHRIAERWRTDRWDSLVANGPAWHDRFSGMAFDEGGEAFVHKDSVADYFERYATRIQAPVPCGVEVRRVSRLEGRPGFQVETTQGVYEAQSVVSATDRSRCL